MKTLGFALLVLGLVVAIVPAQAQGANSFTLTTATAGSDFYFENADGGAKNPTLTVPAGAEVTLTIKNADGGFHNLHVTAPVDKKTADVSAEGDEESVTFTMPASGSVSYQCDYHAATMKGVIKVQSAGATPTTGGDGKSSTPGLAVAGVAVAVLGAALVLRRK